MKDGCGREIDYLRISLTDRCDLRCLYCMPGEGIKHLRHEDILSFEEIQRIVLIMTGLGIRRVRLTGGEPLVRRCVPDLVGMLGKAPLEELAMTTNGCRLAGLAEPLRRAGLTALNISLDTLRPDIFKKLTGTDALEKVLAGIDAAVNAGLHVRLNCVPLWGINDDELAELVLYAGSKRIDIRFIELMPIGCGARMKGMSREEVTEILEKKLGRAESLCEEKDPVGAVRGPAEYFRFQKADNRVGFISPLSHKFCERCNRIRLTAEGYLKLCLQYTAGADLRAALRSGASDEELVQLISEAILNKPSEHSFGSRRDSDPRNMIQIGG